MLQKTSSLALRALLKTAGARAGLRAPAPAMSGLSPAATAYHAASLAQDRPIFVIVPTDGQVEQMTADARFFLANLEAHERIDAVDDLVVLEDLTVLDRKRVERSREFIPGQQQRRRASGLLPRREPRRARVEIVGGDRAHERETRRRARAVAAICHHRVKPFAEDVLEILKGDGERSAVRSSHLL